MDKIESMYSVKQTEREADEVLAKFRTILSHSNFIQGPEVREFEHEVQEYIGCKYTISCANGTDALTVALMAIGLKPGEVILTPSFTYVATAESIAILNGVPYFVDVHPTSYNISLSSLKDAISDLKSKGLKAKAIISVDLFGNPANYSDLLKIARENNLVLIADSAQSFGAKYNGTMVGNIADITTTSFFPTKPLACYGDGGMIMTNNQEYASVMRSICFHGKGDDKYTHVRVGMNSRLDTLQAAVLSVKLKYFDEDLKRRNELAAFYSSHLARYIEVPRIMDGRFSTWAVYNLRHKKRDHIIAALKELGVPSNTYYHTPLHMQKPYTSALKSSNLSASEMCSNEVFSLPMHSYISDDQASYITENLIKIIKSFEG